MRLASRAAVVVPLILVYKSSIRTGVVPGEFCASFPPPKPHPNE